MRSFSSLRAVYRSSSDKRKCIMRILIIASILACIAAEPVPVDVAPVLTPTAPTISAGDINGAVIEAHAEARDNVRAVYDKANELHGQAINHVHDQAWKAVDDVKTIEARLDGAAAASAPIIAKQLVRSGQVGPLASYASPPVAASYPAPAEASYPAPAVPNYTNYAAPAGPSYVNYAAPAEVSYANYAPPAVSPYDAPVVAQYAPSVEDPYYPYYSENQGFY